MIDQSSREDDTGADVVMIARASGAAVLGPSDTNDSRTGGEYTGRDSTFSRLVLCTLTVEAAERPFGGICS